MDKKYTDFMDEISSDELYEGLLAYGFFAEKLPPFFTAVPFFNYCFHVETNGQSYRVSRIHVRKRFDKKYVFDMNYKNWRMDGNPESDLLMHDK